MRLFLKFDDGQWEELGEVKGEDDARYWIERRLEKVGRKAIEGWLADKQIDVQKFVDGYYRKCEKYEKEQREQADKREYERLRKKFGDTK